MLENRIITWENVTHTLTATSHLKPDFFKAIFETISETLLRVPSKRLDNIGADDLSKDSINSLLGFWGKPKKTVQVTETVSHTEDLQRHGPCLKREVTAELHDYIFEQELLSWQSMRPIHQISLDMEQVFLARAYRAARKFCTYDQISAFITDACICHPSKVPRPKLEDCVLREEHKDGTKVFNVRDTEPRMIISNGLPVTDNCLKAFQSG